MMKRVARTEQILSQVCDVKLHDVPEAGLYLIMTDERCSERCNASPFAFWCIAKTIYFRAKVKSLWSAPSHMRRPGRGAEVAGIRAVLSAVAQDVAA
jgi:hypothetical protein